LSVHRLDLDPLRALQPDLIVTQDRAAVCGVSYAEMLEAARLVLGRHVEVLPLHPTLLQDIWDDIYRVGEATQQQRQAATLLEALFARVSTIVAESIMLREPPRVTVLVWTDPLTLAGYWCPELIQLAGGTDGLCRPGAPAPVVEWGRLQEYAPEVLLLSPYGSSLAQTRAALPLVQGLPGGMTSQPYARAMSMRWTDRRISTVLDRVSLPAWKSSLPCSILTFSGNSYPRMGSYTAVSPPEGDTCSPVVAWVPSTLLCSAQAWVAIIAFRARADCGVYCGGKAWKQKTS
jgi:hypothetical protein